MNKLAVVSAVAVSLLALAQHAQGVVGIIFPGMGW